MKKLMVTTLVSAVTLALAACASEGTKESMGSAGAGDAAAQYAAQLKAAEAAYSKVDSVGNAWIAIPELLDDAKKAATEGKYDDALKLVATAKFQSDMSYKQMEEQKKASTTLF